MKHQEATTGRTYRLVKRYEQGGRYTDRADGRTYNLYKIFN